ncbi:hypothetical protein Pyn_13959 [Prunus yedoensis var. nudiflora]|uniref:Uncharacterized protein n=1 Tax=Prunus yedoensis var. nudiflora TaxID=2094558 RepID=A0A314Z1Z6_PRUYE|nr:hypothetical protein Pyn_13959 [Prunus yedoensis var. nudiflora]
MGNSHWFSPKVPFVNLALPCVLEQNKGLEGGRRSHAKPSLITHRTLLCLGDSSRWAEIHYCPLGIKLRRDA